MGCDKSSRDYLSYRQGDKRQASGNKRVGGPVNRQAAANRRAAIWRIDMILNLRRQATSCDNLEN